MGTIQYTDDSFVQDIIKKIEKRNRVHVLHSYLPKIHKETRELTYFTLGEYKPRFTNKNEARTAYHYLESVKESIKKIQVPPSDESWEDYVQTTLQYAGKSRSAIEYVFTRLDYMYLDKTFRNVYKIRNIRLDEALNLLCPDIFSKTPTLKKFLDRIDNQPALNEQFNTFLTIRYMESIAYEDPTAFFADLIQELTWMIVAHYAKKLVMSLGDPKKGLYWVHGNSEPEPYYPTAQYTLHSTDEFTTPLSGNTEIVEHYGEVTVYNLEYPGGTVLHTFPEHLSGTLRNLYSAVERTENRLATHLGFRKAEYLSQHESIKYLVKHYDKEEIMSLDFRDGFGNVEDLISSGYVPSHDHSLKTWSTSQILNSLYKDFVCQQQTFLLVKALQDNSHEEPVLPLDIAVHIASTPEFEATIQEIEAIVNDGKYPEIIEHPDGILEFTGNRVKIH